MNKEETLVTDVSSGEAMPEEPEENTGEEENSGVALNSEPDKPRDPRREAMERIAKETRAERRKDRKRKAKTEEPLGDEDPEPSQSQAQPEPEPASAQKPPEEIFEKDGTYFVKAKIDGEEVDLPYAKVLSAARKLEAGDHRLQEAAKVRSELDQYARQLQQEREQLEKARQAAQQQKQPEQKELSDEDVRSQAKAIIGSLYDGKQEKAEAELANLIHSLKQPAHQQEQQQQIDPNQVAALALQQFRKEQQQQQQAVDLERFRLEYPDVFDNTELYGLVDQIGLSVAQQQPGMGTYDVLVRSTELARNALGMNQQQEPSTSLQQRQEQKRQSAAPISGVNRPSGLGTEPPVPPTWSDKINQIKKARGQRVV